MVIPRGYTRSDRLEMDAWMLIGATLRGERVAVIAPDEAYAEAVVARAKELSERVVDAGTS